MAKNTVKAAKEAAHHNSYDFFFDQLDIVDKDSRHTLKERAKTFKNELHRKDLPYSGTAEDMEKAVDEFLALYGNKYWGSPMRRKLEYPRDRERYFRYLRSASPVANSSAERTSLARIIRALFNFQASMRHIGQKGMSRRWGNAQAGQSAAKVNLSSRHASQDARSRAEVSRHCELGDRRLADPTCPPASISGHNSRPINARIAPLISKRSPRDSRRLTTRQAPGRTSDSERRCTSTPNMGSSQTPEAHHLTYGVEDSMYINGPNTPGGLHYSFADRSHNSISESQSLTFLPWISDSQAHGSQFARELLQDLERDTRNCRHQPHVSPSRDKDDTGHQRIHTEPVDLHSATFPSPSPALVNIKEEPSDFDVVDLVSPDERSPPRRKRQREAHRLDPAIVAGTRLYVSVSTNDKQSSPYPLSIPLEDCLHVQRSPSVTLFPEILAALVENEDLTREQASMVKNAGVSYGWNGKKMRLRVGNTSDWNEFCREIEAAWRGHEEFRQDGCDVAFDVLVPGTGR